MDYSFLEDEGELIFLEDLRPRGFKMTDRTKGMDVPHTLLALKELAKLHAASLILDAKQPLEKLAEKYSFLSLDWHNFPGFSEEMLSMMFEQNYENAAEVLHKFGGYERGEKWLLDHKTKAPGLLKKHMAKEEPFVVICHGDCWNNNMVFR